MNTGGICIGCTMPGFPDRFAPFYKRPPGTLLSSSASRTHGSIIRNLRLVTRKFMNRESRWGLTGEVPSGWGHVSKPNIGERVAHYFYEKLQFFNAEKPGRTHPKEVYPGDYEVPGATRGKAAPPEQRQDQGDR
jgi:hydrogenase small subunit